MKKSVRDSTPHKCKHICDHVIHFSVHIHKFKLITSTNLEIKNHFKILFMTNVQSQSDLVQKLAVVELSGAVIWRIVIVGQEQ